MARGEDKVAILMQKRVCHSEGIFFHFEHRASGKQDSSRMTWVAIQ
jgi:hypothetical protein